MLNLFYMYRRTVSEFNHEPEDWQIYIFMSGPVRLQKQSPNTQQKYLAEFATERYGPVNVHLGSWWLYRWT